MSQSKSNNNKKKRTLYMPGSCAHPCKGEYMPIAEVKDITSESALKREAMKGQEVSD